MFNGRKHPVTNINLDKAGRLLRVRYPKFVYSAFRKRMKTVCGISTFCKKTVLTVVKLMFSLNIGIEN